MALKLVGSISENGLFQKLFSNPEIKETEVIHVLENSYPMVDFNTPVEKISALINKENGAILSKDESGMIHIITKYDILQALAK
jgi:cystathionine beta-synthase